MNPAAAFVLLVLFPFWGPVYYLTETRRRHKEHERDEIERKLLVIAYGDHRLVDDARRRSPSTMKRCGFLWLDERPVVDLKDVVEYIERNRRYPARKHQW